MRSKSIDIQFKREFDGDPLGLKFIQMRALANSGAFKRIENLVKRAENNGNTEISKNAIVNLPYFKDKDKFID